MATLRDLNREEWPDKPFLIELRGGRNDGKRFRWHDLPRVWNQPEPRTIDLTTDMSPSVCPETIRIALYQETGSVTDDGAHIYEFDRYGVA